MTIAHYPDASCSATNNVTTTSINSGQCYSMSTLCQLNNLSTQACNSLYQAVGQSSAMDFSVNLACANNQLSLVYYNSTTCDKASTSLNLGVVPTDQCNMGYKITCSDKNETSTTVGVKSGDAKVQGLLGLTMAAMFTVILL